MTIEQFQKLKVGTVLKRQGELILIVKEIGDIHNSRFRYLAFYQNKIGVALQSCAHNYEEIR